MPTNEYRIELILEYCINQILNTYVLNTCVLIESYNMHLSMHNWMVNRHAGVITHTKSSRVRILNMIASDYVSYSIFQNGQMWTGFWNRCSISARPIAWLLHYKCISWFHHAAANIAKKADISFNKGSN